MNKNMSEESHKKIFISHSSKDKQIVDIFVDKLLHLGLQIDPNDVAYTSREETGVGTGEDIRKFIKENISTCDFVFFMISENYKKSEICLNEMGAALAAEKFGLKYNNEIEQQLEERMLILPSRILGAAWKQVTDDTIAVHLSKGSWRKRTWLRSILTKLNFYRKIFRAQK